MVQNSTYSLKLPTKPKQNPKPTLKQILSGVAASEHRPGAGQWPRLWFSSAVNIKLWLFFSYSCRLKFFLLVHLFKHLSQSHLLFPGTNWEEIILYYPLKKSPNTLTAVWMWNSQTSTQKYLTFVSRMWGPQSCDVHFSHPKSAANPPTVHCCLVLEPLLLNYQCTAEEEPPVHVHVPKAASFSLQPTPGAGVCAGSGAALRTTW